MIGEHKHALTPVFLAHKTSPGNFQAWLAVRGEEDPDFIRRAKRGARALDNIDIATLVVETPIDHQPQ